MTELDAYAWLKQIARGMSVGLRCETLLASWGGMKKYTAYIYPSGAGDPVRCEAETPDAAVRGCIENYNNRAGAFNARAGHWQTTPHAFLGSVA